MTKEKQIELLEKQLAFWKHHSTQLAKALDEAENTAKRYAELLDKTEDELNEDNIMPEAFNPKVAEVVAEAVKAHIVR